MPEIVVGRDEEDLKEHGTKGTLYLGKHLVGTGEETHLTTPVLLDALRPHVITINGKRGSGKCLYGDSLITLEDGRCLSIKELENNENKVLALNNSFKIAEAEKSMFYKRKVDRLIEITLRSGRSIKLTPEHPLLMLFGWMPVMHLKVGDRIAVPRVIPISKGIEIPDYKIKLLAYLIAEGHMKCHGRVNFVKFTNSDEKILREFKECAEKFDINLRVASYKKNEFSVIKKVPYEIKITKRNEKGQIIKYSKKMHNHFLVEWLKEIGLYDKLSKEKIIPECIFKLPKKQLALFLNRLFSCDGSLYRISSEWEISYSSSSAVLIKQVQHFLLRFGILSKLRKKKVKCSGKYFESFELVINGDNVKNFLLEIGFFGAKENRQEESLKIDVKRNPNVDTIPKEIWEAYKPDNWAELGRAFGYKYPKTMRESMRYSPSRQKLLLISKFEHSEDMRLIAESDIFWDEIVKMEALDGDFEVYDITVPDCHNFVANDIIVHNSFSLGVIAEELVKLSPDVANNLCSLIIDTQGIFWTMKSPDEKHLDLIKKWGMEPQGFDTQVYIPEGQKDIFERAGVDFDGVFSFRPSELSAEDWLSVFDLNPNEPLGILIEKTIRLMNEGELEKKYQTGYDIDDIISIVKEQKGFEHEKLALENRFIAAKGWGVFGEAKTPDILVPRKMSVLDVSLTPQNVRALLVSLVCRKLFEERVKARRQEELSEIELIEIERVPMCWVLMDEAHNFVPADGTTASSDILMRLVKEGRQPGITTVFATQRPNKLHPDVLAQCDLIVSHRLTSKADIDALRSVMQTYMLFDIGKYLNELPKLKGTAIILDDNSERLYKVRVRPRQSWHAGASPIAL